MLGKRECSVEIEEEDVAVSSVSQTCRQQRSDGAEARRSMVRQARRWYSEQTGWMGRTHLPSDVPIK
jgi:hypothetical protein